MNEHPARHRILDLLIAEPGLHLRELPRRLGFSLRNTRHHLQQLASQQRVVSQRCGRFQRWFSVQTPVEQRPVVAAARILGQRLILKALLNRGMRFGELSVATNLSPSSLTSNLRRLLSMDLIEHNGPGYSLLEPALVHEVLALYQSTFVDRVVDAAMEIFD